MGSREPYQLKPTSMIVWLEVLADYLRENPPPEHEMDVRSVLVEVRRELRDYNEWKGTRPSVSRPD